MCLPFKPAAQSFHLYVTYVSLASLQGVSSIVIRGPAEREVLKYCEEIGLKCAVDRSKLIGEPGTINKLYEISHLDFFTAQERAK